VAKTQSRNFFVTPRISAALFKDKPLRWTTTRLPRVAEVDNSNPKPAKFYTALQTATPLQHLRK